MTRLPGEQNQAEAAWRNGAIDVEARRKYDTTAVGYDLAVAQDSGSETVRAIQNRPTQRRTRVHPLHHNGCALLSGGMAFEPLSGEPGEPLPVVPLYTPYHPELHHERTWIPNRTKPEDRDDRGKALELKLKFALLPYDPVVDRPERHVSSRSPKGLELISDRRSAGYYHRSVGIGANGKPEFRSTVQVAQDATNPEQSHISGALDQLGRITPFGLAKRFVKEGPDGTVVLDSFAFLSLVTEMLTEDEIAVLEMRAEGYSDRDIARLARGRMPRETRRAWERRAEELLYMPRKLGSLKDSVAVIDEKLAIIAHELSDKKATPTWTGPIWRKFRPRLLAQTGPHFGSYQMLPKWTPKTSCIPATAQTLTRSASMVEHDLRVERRPALHRQMSFHTWMFRRSAGYYPPPCGRTACVGYNEPPVYEFSAPSNLQHTTSKFLSIRF